MNTLHKHAEVIKPEPVVQEWYVDPGQHIISVHASHLKKNLKLTFVDGELTDAEVIKRG
jgi:hypothetical protein